MRATLLVLLACSLVGCGSTPSAATPPRHWDSGGARLSLAPAYWDRGDDERVEIRPNGAVFEGDELVFSIDAQGRVVDSNEVPYLLLAERGHVGGADGWYRGRVGLNNATPGRKYQHQAWLTVASDGDVTLYEHDGERQEGGRWHGCEGPMLRTCTLVTHAVLLRGERQEAEGHPLDGVAGELLVRGAAYGAVGLAYLGAIVGVGLVGQGLAAL